MMRVSRVRTVLLPLLLALALSLTGCGDNAGSPSDGNAASSGECLDEFSPCGFRGHPDGLSWGDCCGGLECWDNPDSEYSQCTPRCTSASDCTGSQCCGPLAGSSVMVCKTVGQCGSSSGPCGSCGPNEYCDSSTGSCECPSGCLDPSSGTCCGGALCSGACVGNSCCP